MTAFTFRLAAGGSTVRGSDTFREAAAELFLPEPIAHGATVAVIVDPIKRVDDLPDRIVADVKSTRTQH